MKRTRKLKAASQRKHPLDHGKHILRTHAHVIATCSVLGLIIGVLLGTLLSPDATQAAETASADKFGKAETRVGEDGYEYTFVDGRWKATGRTGLPLGKEARLQLVQGLETVRNADTLEVLVPTDAKKNQGLYLCPGVSSLKDVKSTCTNAIIVDAKTMGAVLEGKSKLRVVSASRPTDILWISYDAKQEAIVLSGPGLTALNSASAKFNMPEATS